MTQPASHSVDVQNRLGFLHRLMTALAGTARMSLEGNLSRCRFADDLVLGREAVGVLKRNTLRPQLDFVVLKLEPETVWPIYQQIMAAGLKRAIIHVQIDRGGALQLGAYDNFHCECAVTGPAVWASLLAEMQSGGLIRAYRVANLGS